MNPKLPTPSGLYILRSKKHRKRVKAGRSDLPPHRAFELQLGDPDLELIAYAFFLDGRAAEKEMHRRLIEKGARIERETFGVSAKDAVDIFEHLVEEHRPALEQFAAVARYLLDVGAIEIDISDRTQACSGSAMSVLLNHVPSSKDGRNVRTLVSLVLTAGPSAADAAKLLARRGLVYFSVDGLVLLDRSPDTKLAQVFANHPCEETWRQQLAKIAGVNRSGRAVALQEWLNISQAGQELVERICPL